MVASPFIKGKTSLHNTGKYHLFSFVPHNATECWQICEMVSQICQQTALKFKFKFLSNLITITENFLLTIFPLFQNHRIFKILGFNPPGITVCFCSTSIIIRLLLNEINICCSELRVLSLSNVWNPMIGDTIYIWSN